MTMFANSLLRDTQATIRQGAGERCVTPSILVTQSVAENGLVGLVKLPQEGSDSARSNVLRWVHILKHQPWSCQ
jgi:hypothetical protein